MRIVEPTYWVPHIPFAFWIVEALRPRTLVELGTMSGNSYSAFAQAVQLRSVESACYAVDTWKGDAHTGQYGPEVFEELLQFHDQHFGAFSRLVPSTFDDALEKFEDGYIDLLHIDGFHTYEAVRHDFEAWLPKLSPRAVVLFHDVNVRERDYDVWRFWGELTRQYPCFTFLHGHGLGVAGVGRDLPPDVRAIVEQVPCDSHETFMVRQFFGTLGEGLLAQPREAAHKRRQAMLRHEIETAVAERDRLIATAAEREQLAAVLLQQPSEEAAANVTGEQEEAAANVTGEQAANRGCDASVHDLDAARREGEAARRESEVARRQLRDLTRQSKLLRIRLQRAGEQIESDRRRMTEAQAQLMATQAEVQALQERLTGPEAQARWTATQAENEALRERLTAANAVIAAIQSSTSWKITWPVRRLSRTMPLVAAAGRWTLRSLEAGLRSPLGRIPTAAHLPIEPTPTLPQADPLAVAIVPACVGAAVQAGLKRELDWLAPVVLMIDCIYPRPDEDAGSLEALHFIEMFQTLGYQVAFIADTEFSVDSPARKALTTLGVYCVSHSDYGSVEAFLTAASAALDVCFLSRVHSGGRYVEAVKRLCTHAKIVFNTVDLHHVREEREALLKKDRRALNLAWRTRERELAIARLVDATIVVSQSEALLLSETIPGTPVYTIPLVHKSPSRTNGFMPRCGVGFIGNFMHSPNVDAVDYFLDTIWPDVRNRLPGVPFYIIGPGIPDKIWGRTELGVIVVDHVPDLAARLEELRLTVAPLRYGAGAKGKIISSLAHGVPCVATSVAAEGMGIVPGEAIAVGDTPEAFCQQVVTLHTDEEAWTKLSDGGLAFAASRYSFANARRLLAQLLSTINAPVREAVGP
jgi:glycosyltransferase involved in cell wall biosynthesis